MRQAILRRWVFVIVLLGSMISCGAKSWDTGYSRYGFYSSPDDAIGILRAKKNLLPVEHFILARAYKDKNELKSASIHFANSAFLTERSLSLKPFPAPEYKFITSWNRKSDYYEDAALELALIFFRYNEFEYSIKFSALVTESDLSLFRESVLVHARSLEQLKRFDEAIQYLDESIKKFPQKELTTVLYIRLASIYQKKGDNNRAFSTYLESLRLNADGWQGATSSKEAYNLVKDGKAHIDNSCLPVARGLIAAKDFNAAIKVLDSIDISSLNVDLLRISALTGLGRNIEAKKLIEKYSITGAERAGLLSARSDMLWDQGKKSEAADTIREIVMIPQYDSRDQLRRLCYYLYERNSAEAPVYLSLYASKFPRDTASDKMLWLAAKPLIERKDFKAARVYLDEIINYFPEGNYSGNARFWIYRILTSENKNSEAESVFQDMAAFSPGSYYTWILMNRKKGEFSDKSLELLFSEGISKRNPQKALFAHAMLFIRNGNRKSRADRAGEISSAGINQYNTINEIVGKKSFKSKYKDLLLMTEKYFAAGSSEGIQRVINTLPSMSDDPVGKLQLDRDKALLLATFGKKYGNYYQQANGLSALLDSFELQENIFLLSDEAVSMLFPEGFTEAVDKASKSFDVSKTVILSVIKTESMFNHKAMSGVGATGLMQLMPPTAKDISRTLKIADYDMKNPVDSIYFGTYYIAWLNRFFKGNFRDVVAGYNAGAGNVIKWKKDYDHADTDIYTEQIPFDETRAYVLCAEKYLIQYSLLLKKPY